MRPIAASRLTDPETWTDEAALLEAVGVPVHVVSGDPVNLKITVPDDLVRAEAILTGGRATRTGIGHDSHPFGPDMPLMLGGVEIAGAPRLYGHSDGDVVLHAIADALLGATALGDLGRLFPADARTPRGIASSELLRSVRARLADAGWRPTSVDVTVIAARPRLDDHLEAMRAAIGNLLGLDVSAVNVKASSGNLDGAEGAGRSISAVAIAMVADPMTVRLHDTLTGQTRALVPLRADRVGVYSCGPTVYGPAHIGNFRSFLFADLLVRHLRWRGLPGDLGHEHHRHRRQDHPRCRRRGRSGSTSSPSAISTGSWPTRRRSG